jgi:hypothetical protein
LGSYQPQLAAYQYLVNTTKDNNIISHRSNKQTNKGTPTSL